MASAHSACCRIAERLTEVLFFQIRVLAENLPPVSIGGQDLQNTTHRDTHASNTRLTSALARFDGCPVKRWILSHEAQFTRFWQGSEKCQNLAEGDDAAIQLVIMGGEPFGHARLRVISEGMLVSSRNPVIVRCHGQYPVPFEIDYWQIGHSSKRVP
jgi:hypothetical protein